MKNVDKMINGVVTKQVEAKQITSEDVNIYLYGYTLLYEVLINTVIAILIGVISNDLSEVLLFLIIYIPLRSFCGGWHADKFWKCTIYSNLILVAMIFIDDILLEHSIKWVTILVFCLCVALIYLLAPIETETKPISIQEKKIYKKKIDIILICNTLLWCILLFFDYKRIIFAIEYAYFVQVVMLIAEIINKKKKDFSEKCNYRNDKKD